MKQLLQIFEACYSTQLLSLYFDLSLDAIGAGQDAMDYKIMLTRLFCSQVNLKPVFVVSDL